MTPGMAVAEQLAEAHGMLELVMADVTPEMFTWRPPKDIVPIGAIYAHAIGVEDLYIHQIIQGAPLQWQTGLWSARLGHAAPPNTWNITKTPPPDTAALDAYKQAVFAGGLDYVRGLTGEDLSREVRFPGRDFGMSLARLIAVVITHTAGHAGEIAMLKGLQGGRGLPY